MNKLNECLLARRSPLLLYWLGDVQHAEYRYRHRQRHRASWSTIAAGPAVNTPPSLASLLNSAAAAAAAAGRRQLAGHAAEGVTWPKATAERLLPPSATPPPLATVVSRR